MSAPATVFASNALYLAPVEEPDLGEDTKVAMTEEQRANGFVPEEPVAAEHLNFELNALGTDIFNAFAAIEGSALSNYTDQATGQANTLQDIVWDAERSQFVAVGATGTILTSEHGREWTAQTSGVVTGLNGVGANSSIIVAVGAGGVIRTSPTGVTWTSRTSGTAEDLRAVTWSSDLSLFIAVGDAGVIRTSPDGITWTARTSGTGADLISVAASPSLVAVGGTGGDLLTSPDAITWTARSSGSGNFLAGLAWKSGMFVAAGNAGYLITSPDGIVWTTRTSGSSEDIRGATATGYFFLLVGDGAVRISRDGITWDVADGLSTDINHKVAWSGRVAVVTVAGGAVSRSHRQLNA